MSYSFIASEFEIDEAPLDIGGGGADLVPEEEENEGSAAAALADLLGERGPTWPGAPSDMLTIFAGLLTKQHELSAELHQLRTSVPKDDEFSKFVRQFLPFIDAISRIVTLGRAHGDQGEIARWLQTVEKAYDRLRQTLEKFDVEILDSEGREVDLAVHEVIEYRETDEHPHNIVIEEVQKGIRFRGKMLRDARVIVACNE